MTPAVPPRLVTTRLALHAVAEGLLAAPQYRAVGTIRLAARAGGLATTRPYGDVDLVAVEGTDLLVVRGGRQRRLPLSGTCGDLAEQAGLPLGRLDDLYPDSVRPEPSTRLDVDPDAAATLAAAWELGDLALREFAAAASPAAPIPVIWPEHLDVAVSVDGAGYGVSPGDGTILVPYAYVTPATTPHTGPFWNQPFGAAQPLTGLPDQGAITQFFRTGHNLATRAPS